MFRVGWRCAPPVRESGVTPDEERGPSCLTAEETAAWWYADSLITGVHNRAGLSPCADCTAAFEAEMREQGRCLLQPGERRARMSVQRGGGVGRNPPPRPAAL
jgi:hypothetical protein